MQSRKLEQRGTIVSGIAWEPTKLPQQRICGCGRLIARISKSDICQRCIDREYAEKFQTMQHPKPPPTWQERLEKWFARQNERKHPSGQPECDEPTEPRRRRRGVPQSSDEEQNEREDQQYQG